MSNPFTPISTQYISFDNTLFNPIFLPKVLHVDDPASDALIAFKTTQPVIVDKKTSITECRSLLENSVLPIAFVVDGKQHLLGLLSLKKIKSELPIKQLESSRLHREELTVQSVVTPIKNIPTVEYQRLERAKVGHIISTFEAEKICYLLVSEQQGEQQRIKGLFWANTIEQMTGQKIRIPNETVNVFHSTN